MKPPGRRGLLFSHQSKGEWGEGKTPCSRLWWGLCCPSKKTERGRGLLLRARVTSLWPCLSPWGCLLFSAVCLGDLPDHGTLLFLPAPVLWSLKAIALAGRRVWLTRRYREKWQEMSAGSWWPWPRCPCCWLALVTHLLSRPHYPCVIFGGPHSRSSWK